MNGIQENLSKFEYIEKVLEPIEEEAFFKNNIEEEDNISKNQASKVKNKGKNPWIQFQNQRLVLDTTDTDTKNKTGYNKYFMPVFCILEQTTSTSDALLVKYFT